MQTIDYILIVVIGILAILDIVLYTINYKKDTIPNSEDSLKDTANMQEVLPSDSSTDLQDGSNGTE